MSEAGVVRRRRTQAEVEALVAGRIGQDVVGVRVWTGDADICCSRHDGHAQALQWSLRSGARSSGLYSGERARFHFHERAAYHFSFKENLNKRYADRRANIKDATIGDRVRAEVENLFAASNGIVPIFFPEDSGKVPDKPTLTFVVLAPEQSTEDEKRVEPFIEGVIREHGSSSRTFKSALVFGIRLSNAPVVPLGLVVHLSNERRRSGTEAA